MVSTKKAFAGATALQIRRLYESRGRKSHHPKRHYENGVAARHPAGGNGPALRLGELGDHASDGPRGLGVEARRRLVDQQDRLLRLRGFRVAAMRNERNQ